MDPGFSRPEDRRCIVSGCERAPATGRDLCPKHIDAERRIVAGLIEAEEFRERLRKTAQGLRENEGRAGDPGFAEVLAELEAES